MTYSDQLCAAMRGTAPPPDGYSYEPLPGEGLPVARPLPESRLMLAGVRAVAEAAQYRVLPDRASAHVPGARRPREEA